LLATADDVMNGDALCDGRVRCWPKADMTVRDSDVGGLANSNGHFWLWKSL
jgi:hypothetical protein